MASISKEPIKKNHLSISFAIAPIRTVPQSALKKTLLCYKGKLSPSLLKHLDNDRQTFRNQYKSADAQAYLRLFLLYPLKITHEGV